MSWELEVVQGPNIGSRIPLSGEITLGRDPQASCMLHDPQLGRVHCRVFVRDGLCYVVDISGGIGTYLNGSAVAAAPVQMRPGDTIGMGGTVLRLNDLAGAPTHHPHGMPTQAMPHQPHAHYPPQDPAAPHIPQAYPSHPPLQAQQPMHHPPQGYAHPPQQPYAQPPAWDPATGQVYHPPTPQVHPHSSGMNVVQQVTVVNQSGTAAPSQDGSSSGWPLWATLLIVSLFLFPCAWICLSMAILAALPYIMLLGGAGLGIAGLVMWQKYRDYPGWDAQANKGMIMMITGFSLSGLGLIWVIISAIAMSAPPT